MDLSTHIEYDFQDMKIYLDTSVLSVLFDGRNPERKELTKDFFSKIQEKDILKMHIM